MGGLSLTELPNVAEELLKRWTIRDELYQRRGLTEQQANAVYEWRRQELDEIPPAMAREVERRLNMFVAKYGITPKR